jgi:hypothetical protein
VDVACAVLGHFTLPPKVLHLFPTTFFFNQVRPENENVGSKRTFLRIQCRPSTTKQGVYFVIDNGPLHAYSFDVDARGRLAVNHRLSPYTSRGIHSCGRSYYTLGIWRRISHNSCSTHNETLVQISWQGGVTATSELGKVNVPLLLLVPAHLVRGDGCRQLYGTI